MELEGNFILDKTSIIDGFIGGKNIVSIYLGKTLVWAKETSSLKSALFDEISRPFVTEDETNVISIDISI